MMFHNKFAAIAGALLLAGSVFAGQSQLCPDINSIKAEGLNMAEKISANVFLTYNISTYSTNDVWGFVIAPIVSDTEETAIDQANNILSTMSSPGIPDEEDGEIVCLYDTGRPDVIAAAINTEGMISPSKLKQYIRKVK